MNAALVIAEASDQPVWWLFGATVALATFAALGLLGLLDARRTRYGGAVAEIARRWDDPDVRESFQLSREYGEEGLSELIRALFGGSVTSAGEERLRGLGDHRRLAEPSGNDRRSDDASCDL